LSQACSLHEDVDARPPLSLDSDVAFWAIVVNCQMLGTAGALSALKNTPHLVDEEPSNCGLFLCYEGLRIKLRKAGCKHSVNHSNEMPPVGRRVARPPTEIASAGSSNSGQMSPSRGARAVATKWSASASA
jgi:hypothetical protein